MTTLRVLLATVLTLALGACGSSSGSPAPRSSAASSRAGAGQPGGGTTSSSTTPTGSASFTPGTSGGGASAFRVLVTKKHVLVPPPAVSGDNYDITATIQGCPVGGRWVYSGTWRIISRSVNDGNVNDNTGGVLDLKGGQQPDGATLTLSFVATAADNAKLPASVRDGQGRFLLSGTTTAPAVRFQAFRGSGGPLPVVALGVTAQTPQCG